ncbi:MAG: isoleucine--tRNA ligase, partial [Bacteroidales bacterium]|nr:isoleucine--tRNA ligase [Bacteroidales bacterium]
ELGPEDLEVSTEDIPGWVVANDGSLTVALDISISDELYREGLARELINRIQNLRKEQGFEVTDKIRIVMETREELLPSVEKNIEYICAETLAESLELVDILAEEGSRDVELTEEISTRIHVSKMQ